LGKIDLDGIKTKGRGKNKPKEETGKEKKKKKDTAIREEEKNKQEEAVSVEPIKQEETAVSEPVKQEETVILAEPVKEEETILVKPTKKEETILVEPVKQEETVVLTEPMKLEETVIIEPLKQEETVIPVEPIKQEETVIVEPLKQEETVFTEPIHQEETIPDEPIRQEETVILAELEKQQEIKPIEQTEQKEEINIEFEHEEGKQLLVNEDKEEEKQDEQQEEISSEQKKEPEMFRPTILNLKTPTVIGKVDLTSINSRTKPKKRTLEELKKEKEENRRFYEENILQQTPKPTDDKKRKDKREKRNEREKTKSNNFIETTVDRLSGVKVVDKIDISTPKKDGKPRYDKDGKPLYDRDSKPRYDRDSKPRYDRDSKPGHDRDSKPRYDRDSKPGYDRDSKPSYDKDGKPRYDKDAKPQYDRNRTQSDKDKPQSDQGKRTVKRKRIKVSTDKGADKDRNHDKNFSFQNKRKDIRRDKKVEITEEEVETQIKKTMARMAPVGKTKAAKHRREKREQIHQEIEQAHERQEQEKNVLKVTEFITVNDLANMMNIPVGKIIAACMSIGLVVAINQRLDADNIVLLAEEYGYTVQFVGVEEEDEKQKEISNPEDLESRAPIVTVMGHVDHGKTSLLDYIRNTNVIAGEAGGITQHIGAYEVELSDKRKITFLDTPGHEAFTAMRARGAKITDIVIVVIASDDAIMPQTIEAINHAQAANVPMIFAINKIDKPGADPERIRSALANMNLLVEEWGGKIQSQDISAKKGINVDILLEKVLIEAEMLELKANPTLHATGTVIESSLDKGRGYIAKMLIQNGTLRKGDIVVAGTSYGKIKAMYNERNQLIQAAYPSSPVLLLGLDSAPQAGDTFKVYTDEREAKSIVSKRQQLIREQGLRTQKHITLTEIGRRIAVGDFKELNIIVKGDVDGSIEALSDSLLRLTTEGVEVKIIHKSVGQVTESDVLLASASNAIIIAFQVRPSSGARKLAEQEQIDIRTYSVIYDAINEIKDAIEGMKAPEIKESIVCNVEVREVFRISKVGTIAGCYVLDGKVQRNTRIRVIRDGIVIFTGKLGSLKRFKDDVKEVTSGYECGLNIESFNDVKIGDIIEGFEEVEVRR
jgi:translation initiation factor IF-2